MTSFSRWLGALSAMLVVVSNPVLAQTRAALGASVYKLEDRGQKRAFEVALDEIFVGEPGKDSGRAERLPAKVANSEAIRAHAQRRSEAGAIPTELILYPAGEEHTEAHRRILTHRILVKLRPGADGESLARGLGLTFKGNAGFNSGMVWFEATVTGGSLEAAQQLGRLPDVVSAEPQLARQQHKRAVPNDPFFSQQWHLRNTGQGSGLPGIDVNVTSVWDSYQGTGLRIGIVDDGLQLTHPDLQPNIDTANDHDWNDATADDPSPSVSLDFHGTSCAGVAAGRGGNGLGISGAAPQATLVGLRLIAATTTDQQEAEAMAWKSDVIQVKSNSWGPSDDAKTLEGPGPLTIGALADAAANGRGGLGTIFVWAGGNGGDVGDNSNYDGYANSIYTIAVGAIGNDGKRSYYSEPGANLLVTAPSSGGTLGIVTTDLIGDNGYNNSLVAGELSNRDYTNDFGGTSSACPLTAGCIALLLQSNPALGWRDVQEILIRSARKVDATDGDWTVNAAGFHFNHNYGAGLLDTQAAVTLAAHWTDLPAQTSLISSQTGLNVAIPDNNSAGITRTFNLSASNLRAEQVSVTVNINHTSRGQLAITLISPSGTQSRLTEKHSDTGDNFANWTFSTVRNWGEDAQGAWTLKVADLTSGTLGSLTSATLTVYGTPAPPVNQPPSVTAVSLSTSIAAFEDESVSVTNVTASDPEGDSISFGYQWQESTDNVAFTAIAGAATPAYTPAGKSGKLVRCQVTPTAAGKSGAAFTTAAVAINRRPPSIARAGQSFSYDSDLYLSTQAANLSRVAIINEVSQGASGSKEWIELLTLKTADLRGYTLGDRGGTYVTFSQSTVWSAIPPGTLIVIYNGNDRDTILPANDADPAGGSMVLSHVTTGLFSTSAWGGLSNSTADSVIFRNPSAQIVDALSLNGENVYDPKLGTLAAGKVAYYAGNTDSGADQISNWTLAASSTATPAVGNGGSNSQFVTDLRTGGLNAVPKFRLAASSDVIPGLAIDADSGVLSGLTSASAAGVYNVVIERFTATDTAQQNFSVIVLSADGSGTIGSGKTWKLSGDVAIPGSLTINGTLDTNGHTLTIAGTLQLGTGSVVVNATGAVIFNQLNGNPPPGSVALAPNPATDLADPDGDRLPTLVEFAFGTNPAAPNGAAGFLTSAMNGSFPEYTMHFPAGATGVTRLVEVSSDLVSWRSGAGATQIISDVTDQNGIRAITVRDITGAGTHFARIRVSR